MWTCSAGGHGTQWAANFLTTASGQSVIERLADNRRRVDRCRQLNQKVLLGSGKTTVIAVGTEYLAEDQCAQCQRDRPPRSTFDRAT